MSDYVIWTRGLSDFEISVLRGRSVLSEFERRRIVSGPTPIKPEHADEPLSVLARLYPPPAPPPPGAVVRLPDPKPPVTGGAAVEASAA